MVAVDHPLLAWAAGLAAVLVLGWRLVAARSRAARLARIGTPSLLARLVPGGGAPGAPIGALRPALAAALAVLALAGPRWGTPQLARDAEGIDIVIAVDASLSMLAEDERPSRLLRARQEVQRLVAGARGDRFGLIAFAGRSYILTPLTSDAGAMALFLDNLDPSIVGEPGSSLAAALRQGRELLGPATSGDRALVLFTDGEAFDEDEAIDEAARQIRSAGIALVLVGLGSADGASIPIEVDGRWTTKRDADDVEVLTRFDGDRLVRIAALAGGTAIEATASDKANRVRAELAGLQGSARRAAVRQSIPLRYQWVLSVALLLVLWERLGPFRRRLAPLLLSAVLGWSAPATAQARRDLTRAQAEFDADRPLAAVRLWRGALEQGAGSPQLLYNLGTAYLAADSLDSAIEVLERVVAAPRAAYTESALFNLGLAYLRRGLATGGTDGTTSLRNAVRSYRQVLLSAPTDPAARFNYELAVRELDQRGGGAAGGPPPPSAGGRGGGPQQDMPREQAAQLLDAAAREERQTRARQQPGRPTVPLRGRDW